jgi:uncharacterized damage-inducible protein DinB
VAAYRAPERPDDQAASSAGEASQLLAWLAFHRGTLLAKCDGLDDDQLALRPVVTSRLSLLGLVRHMAAVEQYWIDDAFLGGSPTWFIDATDNPDADFDDLEASTMDDATTWLSLAAATTTACIEAHDLDDVAATTMASPTPLNLRWIVLHLIEEYARHNGHADILRELIDGQTGW